MFPFRQSISRMHDTMMARLQEAANKPTPREEEEKESKSSAADIEQAGEVTLDHDTTEGVGEEETDTEAPRQDGTGVREDWIEETVEHPAPDYGVDSPVIRSAVGRGDSCGEVVIVVVIVVVTLVPATRLLFWLLVVLLGAETRGVRRLLRALV